MDERFSAARNRKLDVTEAYSYPDNEDRILSSFVDQQQPYPGYWAESEERALARLGAHLANLLPARHLVHAMDAGCGPGRALPWIATFAERIVAVDPDLSRMAEARKHEHLPDTRVSFENIPIGEAGGGPYQLIVCNHVVQHVSTEMAQLILSKFSELAAPEAILVMSFSRSPVGRESYGIAHMNGSVSSFEKIDRSAFDSLAGAGGSPGYLPVRMIDPDIFAADALAVGWKSCWHWTYHSMGQPETGPGADRDEMINDSPSLLRQSEGDIYVIMHR